MTHVLVTGGGGLIAGRVASELAAHGARVTLASRTARARSLPGVTAARIDWQDRADLERLCEGVHAVVHAMGMNADDCAADPGMALHVNGACTQLLVDAAVKAGVRRFAYVSTAHVYASPLAGTVTEQDCPRNLHPYATSHLAAENAVRWSGQTRALETLVVRLSNAFGAPVDPAAPCWSLLVNDLCRQAVQSGRLRLRSSGTQERDFVALSRVCEVLSSWCLGDTLPGLLGDSTSIQPVNLGSGRAVTVLAMAERIRRRCAVTLGLEVVIDRPAVADGAAHLATPEPLHYTSRLAYAHDPEREDVEIDRLLAFCRTHFSAPVATA